MGTKRHRDRYTERELRFFKEIGDGLLESRCGRFETIRVSDFQWEMTDRKTKEKFNGYRKVDMIKRALATLDAEAAAAAEKPKALPEASPAVSASDAQAVVQLKLIPTARLRLANVALMEVDGQQVVVGFDASNRAHTLWTGERER